MENEISLKGPVFPDACGHEGYIGSFEAMNTIRDGVRQYDLYVIPKSQEICIRYGAKCEEYISPGSVAEFLMRCHSNEIKRRAALLLLDRGQVVWAPVGHKKVSRVVTLFDDKSVKEKITVMTKWEAMIDDERNTSDIEEEVEKILEPGKSYRFTIEEML